MSGELALLSEVCWFIIVLNYSSGVGCWCVCVYLFRLMNE